MGKTSYDLFFDDKAFGLSKDWEKKVRSSFLK